MGEWMHENGMSGSRVIAGKQWVVYCADAVRVDTPAMGPSELLRYARKHQVDYMVADTRYLATRNPDLAIFVADSSNANTEELELIHEISVTLPTAHRIRLWRILYPEKTRSSYESSGRSATDGRLLIGEAPRGTMGEELC